MLLNLVRQSLRRRLSGRQQTDEQPDHRYNSNHLDYLCCLHKNLGKWLNKNFVLKNRRNAAGRTFCDAITFNLSKFADLNQAARFSIVA
jgi:hypothetical protein